MVTGEKSKTGQRVAIGVLSVFSLIWVAPILFTLLQSFRPYDDVIKKGVMSWPSHLTFSNYYHAFVQSRMWLFFLNSVEVAVPAVVLTLFLASMIAFVLSRYESRASVPLLMLFTAGNLLPPQLLFIPIFRIYLKIHVPHFINSNGVLYDTQFSYRI